MAAEKEEDQKFDDFLQGIGWFVLAFIVLMALFFFLRPVFFVDLIEPFLDWFGLHNALRDITALMVFVYEEYGIFLVFLVIVYFWWAFFTKKNGKEKKESKK